MSGIGMLLDGLRSMLSPPFFWGGGQWYKFCRRFQSPGTCLGFMLSIDAIQVFRTSDLHICSTAP